MLPSDAQPPAGTALAEGNGFQEYSMLLMNSSGRFVREGLDGEFHEIRPRGLPDYLDEYIVLPDDVSDVFIWVHGWRNDLKAAHANAARMFHAIRDMGQRDRDRYPRLSDFQPAFVAVHWPSWSAPTPQGYRSIRDRARAMTDDGFAEFFLASLLGYLQPTTTAAGGRRPGTLRSRRGFYVHCLGHSFGGRFLTAAVGAAARPQAPATLSLLGAAPSPWRAVLSATNPQRFEFEVDSLVVFQMAAPNRRFGESLRGLVSEGPLRGSILLTHSLNDRANSLWHRFMEGGEPGIGATGAIEPQDLLKWIHLLAPGSPYVLEDLAGGNIVNVDANPFFCMSKLYQVEGAHSDFWYEESIHLALSAGRGRQAMMTEVTLLTVAPRHAADHGRGDASPDQLRLYLRRAGSGKPRRGSAGNGSSSRSAEVEIVSFTSVISSKFGHD